MMYPLSPFSDEFNPETILRYADEPGIQNEYLAKLLPWLCTTPSVTCYRVNTLLSTVQEIEALILKKVPALDIFIKTHTAFPEVIILHHQITGNVPISKSEIIVDVHCAASVLRGAHIFAPGVLAMPSGAKYNDEVSIYADVSGKCKKGLQKFYDDPKKVFIGNGIVRMVRHQLYGENLTPTGIAVEITESVSGCPLIGDIFPPGFVLLQNLPSIVCVHVLDPKPGDIILDMCAAPGNKTSLIAALMKNQGVLVAVDKTPSKIKQLEERCSEFGVEAKIFQANSIQICDDRIEVLKGPPFPKEAFDKILLDAPCSALGKRPQLYNNISEKVLNSYVPLQRKLFETAVDLLKIDGTLVYSTCTVTLSENEGIVAWALKKFDCLKLKMAEPHLAGPGLTLPGLTEEDCDYVQRFGPEQEVDSVGFFIACFIKIKTM